MGPVVQGNLTQEKGQQVGTDNNLADARGPEGIDRRDILRRFATAAASLLLANTTTSALAMVQEPEKSPEKKNIPGLDSPLKVSLLTIPDRVYDREANQKPIRDAQIGTARLPSPGGALQIAAVLAEKVGRNNIPAGHLMVLSVDGAKGEKTFVIDPAKVPSSNFTQADFDKAIKGAEKDPELAQFVNDFQRGGLGVLVSIGGKQQGVSPSINFEFVKNSAGDPATISVQFVDPKERQRNPAP